MHALREMSNRKPHQSLLIAVCLLFLQKQKVYEERYTCTMSIQCHRSNLIIQEEMHTPTVPHSIRPLKICRQLFEHTRNTVMAKGSTER